VLASNCTSAATITLKKFNGSAHPLAARPIEYSDEQPPRVWRFGMPASLCSTAGVRGGGEGLGAGEHAGAEERGKSEVVRQD
jgi:hypothetical protein